MKTTNPEDRAQQIFDEIKAIRATAEERVDAINEAAGEKIAKKLAELAAIATTKAPSGPAKARLSKPRGERKPRANGIPARILAFLGTNIASYTADELIGELKIEPEKVGQLRTTLSRLLKQGKIASPASGVYEAKR